MFCTVCFFHVFVTVNTEFWYQGIKWNNSNSIKNINITQAPQAFENITSQALPNPGELRMAKSMSDLKAVYTAWTGMHRIFSQVLATGNREQVMNSRVGFGEKPSAGMLSHPVNKTRTSSRETLFSTIKHKKRVPQLNDEYVKWYHWSNAKVL